MGSDASKTELEKQALLKFIAAANYPIDVTSIEKLDGERLPDFSCSTTDGVRFAVEVTELCDEDIAKMIDISKRVASASVWTNSPTAILKRKMQKTYATDLPIELLCYLDGRVVDTDDMMRVKIEEIANGDTNPFRRVWFHGEDGVYLMYGDR